MLVFNPLCSVRVSQQISVISRHDLAVLRQWSRCCRASARVSTPGCRPALQSSQDVGNLPLCASTRRINDSARLARSLARVRHNRPRSARTTTTSSASCRSGFCNVDFLRSRIKMDCWYDRLRNKKLSRTRSRNIVCTSGYSVEYRYTQTCGSRNRPPDNSRLGATESD